MRARLHLTLTDARGGVLAERRAANAVMQQGARLVAELFAGQGGPITHMGVGTSDAPDGEAYDTAALTTDGLGGEVVAAVPADAFFFAVDAERRVLTVRVRGTLPAAAAVTDADAGASIREAGLIARTEAGDVLYNRVTFDPLGKGDDHEMTLFWEVTFPYGDLHFL